MNKLAIKISIGLLFSSILYPAETTSNSPQISFAHVGDNDVVESGQWLALINENNISINTRIINVINDESGSRIEPGDVNKEKVICLLRNFQTIKPNYSYALWEPNQGWFYFSPIKSDSLKATGAIFSPSESGCIYYIDKTLLKTTFIGRGETVFIADLNFDGIPDIIFESHESWGCDELTGGGSHDITISISANGKPEWKSTHFGYGTE